MQGYIYEMKKTSLDTIVLNKDSFTEKDIASLTIQNRALTQPEKHMYHYEYRFTKELFADRLIQGRAPVRPNWYLIIEKPDCQYLDVQLNNQSIGMKGQLSGQANLWNGYFVFEFNEGALNEQNLLRINMMSDYMTGVAGDIFFISAENFETLKFYMDINEQIIMATSIIAFFAAFILSLFIISLRKKIYNMIAYSYFVLSIITMGISMLDYQVIEYMSLDILIFKKIILLSYHLSITFVVLAVSYLVNTRVKLNMGMVGVVVLAVSSIFVQDAITFRHIYMWANYGLIVAVIQMMVILIRYRKRTTKSATLLLFGFGLCGTTILKLVLITSDVIQGNNHIDMAIIVIISVTLVLYTLFLELISLSQDGVLIGELDSEKNKYLMLNGNFTLDKKHQAVAPYSMICDHIFQRFILGESIADLFYPEDEPNRRFLVETLDLFFNNAYEFKDGFLSLLPNEITINKRVYYINYIPEQKEQLFLSVQLHDVTHIKELEKDMTLYQQEMFLVINSLKNKDELAFIIKKTRESIEYLRNNDINESFKNELHTIKGNLGQFGFKKFELIIHQIESELVNSNKTVLDKENIISLLNKGLDDELDSLYEYIGKGFFNETEETFSVKESQLVHIEDKLEKLSRIKDQESYESYKEYVADSFLSIRQISFIEMFYRFVDFVEIISKNMGKNCSTFEISGDDIYVRKSVAEPFLQVAVSIIRNSVRHGIETSDIRVEKGKDSFGKVHCRFEITGESSQNICIHFIDDGQGVDLAYLKQKLIEKKVMEVDQLNELPDETLLQMIFMRELSMTEAVDIYSGRGIGLSAVKEYVELLGGTIRVESILDQMTDIIVLLPIEKLQ